MDFMVKINCDNAAFADSVAGYELARILRELAAKLENDTGPHPLVPYRAKEPLRDSNGNRVGEAWFPRD